MTAAGWLDLNNQRGRLTVGGLDIALAGVHDAHIKKDRYEQVAGRADPAADLRLGVMHSPEPRLLDQFAADGYELLLAGHTHGGQLCLPFYGTLVTNCGIDRERARGLHRYPDGRPRLAARFRRAGHVALGAGQVRLPPGGQPAHAGTARFRLSRPGVSAPLRSCCWQACPSGSAFPLDCRSLVRHR